MLSGSALSVGREALQAAHDALSDLGACMRGLPKEIPANNDTLYALLEVLVEKIKFMRWVDCSFRSAYTAGEKKAASVFLTMTHTHGPQLKHMPTHACSRDVPPTRPRKVLAIPAGWPVEQGGTHPVVLALQKQEDGTYSLSVINAGQQHIS